MLSSVDAANEVGKFSHLAAAVNLPSKRASRVSPDGLHAAFASTAPLTGYDNTDLNSGQPNAEVYMFDATARGGEGSLTCVSCQPSGRRPAGRKIFSDQSSSLFASAEIPGWTFATQPTRSLSANGARLFFDAYDSLVPADTNGQEDVYEWEAPGEGSCTEESSAFSEANGGCIYLISSGQSAKDSEFFDATPNGSDVFFATNSSLLKADYGLTDVYDARVNGGLPEPSPPGASCEGEACQGTTEAPADPTPSSSAFEGAGNVREEATQVRCTKGKVRKKGRCVKRHSKRHRRHPVRRDRRAASIER